MPFPGNMVGAPVMAAKQGMKDISFAAVTDTSQPVLQYVNGPLTGKGSGLLTPVTQSFSGVTQSSLTQAAQAPGRAMSLGSSSFSPAGGGGGSSAPAPGLSAAAFNALGLGSGGGGSGGAQSMAAAQAMMAGGGNAMGSAAAMAGSGMGGGGQGMSGSGMGSGAAAAAAGAGGAGLNSLPGLTPGQLPGGPQFTPLPVIPSLPRLSDVLARLGGMISGGGASGPGSDALSGAGGSGAAAPPASQFGGSAPADPTEEEFT